MNLYLIIVNFTFDRFYFVYTLENDDGYSTCIHFLFDFFFISELKKKM